MPANKQETRLVKPLPKGQLTIPVAFRRKLGIGENTILSVTLKEGRLEIAPFRPPPETALRDYTDADIKRFLKEDRIDRKTDSLIQRTLTSWPLLCKAEPASS